MSDITFTKEQESAVTDRGGSLLVSAAAGSGKTRVLVERLMKYITEENRSVCDFLIITFTNAAAAELRAKIRAAINERLKQTPGDRRLRREADMCFRASIGTIHSFCVGILRENTHKLGISPDFRVADEGESALIREETLEKLLEEKYETSAQNEGFLMLVDLMSAGRDDSKIIKLVLDTYNKLRCRADPDVWMKNQIAQMAVESSTDLSETVWGGFLLRRAKSSAEYHAERLEKLLDNADEDFLNAYGGSVSDTLKGIYGFIGAKGWNEAKLLSDIQFPRAKNLKGHDEEKKERLTCKSALAKLKDYFKADSDKLIEDLNLSGKLVGELLKLVSEFEAAYSEEKHRRGVIDFSDQEHMALRLLIDAETGQPTPAARELSQRFCEIMVDEYQDVNAVQELIFNAVSRDGKNLFMVGDVKQSIYRFRLADPSIFLSKYRTFADCGDAQEGEPRRILLQKNFRSRRGVLDAANTVFSNIMSEGFGGMDYTEREALICGSEYPENGEICTELDIIDLADNDFDEEAPVKTEIEARYVAGRIAELVGQTNVSDGHGGTRPAEYGDFAILLRATKQSAIYYANALADRGIPVASGNGVSPLKSPEVTILLSILAITDNPRQDVPLVSAMRSPVWGFTPDELAHIRINCHGGDFWTAVCAASDTDKKCRDFITDVGSFRDAAPDMTVSELIWHICTETDLFGIAGAMHTEGSAEVNLEALIVCARRFEATGYRGLFRFLSYVKTEQERVDDVSAASDSQNAVHIMTIHKSKGLEFPIVILAGLSSNINMRDADEPLLIDMKLGIGAKTADLKLRAEFPTVARLAIAARIRDETFAEELRVLYVAMTRAKEKLIMTASFTDAQNEIGKLSDISLPAAPEYLRGTKRMIDWILLSVLQTPDAASLRGEEPENPPEKWLIRRISASEITDAKRENVVEAAQNAAPDAALTEKIRENLAYRYPYAEAVDLPSKLTATELKSRRREFEAADEAETLIHETDVPLRTPDFSQSKTLSAAERGTAAHLALQFAELESCITYDGAMAEIDRLRNAGILSEQQANAVEYEKLTHFALSETGVRIRAADKVLREFKFSLLVPASELKIGQGSDEILLQGVIDCCIEENGELTVIDYKTDRLYDCTAEERAKKYAPQLEAYTIAIERITGKPVRESILWFFSAEKSVFLRKNQK